jgi:magnesium chelatase subunit I
MASITVLNHMASPFPFSAIVGQDDMKLALMIAAVDPTVGGVLIIGDRGTGKSTAVRALAALLPKLNVVSGCAYHCDPGYSAGLCATCQDKLSTGSLPIVQSPASVVDLPLGATEDRVVGALDLERALSVGEKAFEPGLLAKANRGFLYIDEVNLLEDHLVDLLLDVAASGENVIEREGLSVRHPARFVLIGSGNPEEGELRPQLLDRFGLAVEVKTPADVPSRIEVIRRRDSFERNPERFAEQWREADEALRDQIVAARAKLDLMSIPEATLEATAKLCISLGTDGLRGELTLLRAARAFASINGDDEVTEGHLRQIASSALRHRLRKNPLDQVGSTVRVERAVEELFGV